MNFFFFNYSCLFLMPRASCFRMSRTRPYTLPVPSSETQMHPQRDANGTRVVLCREDESNGAKRACSSVIVVIPSYKTAGSYSRAGGAPARLSRDAESGETRAPANEPHDGRFRENVIYLPGRSKSPFKRKRVFRLTYLEYFTV